MASCIVYKRFSSSSELRFDRDQPPKKISSLEAGMTAYLASGDYSIDNIFLEIQTFCTAFLHKYSEINPDEAEHMEEILRQYLVKFEQQLKASRNPNEIQETLEDFKCSLLHLPLLECEQVEIPIWLAEDPENPVIEDIYKLAQDRKDLHLGVQSFGVQQLLNLYPSTHHLQNFLIKNRDFFVLALSFRPEEETKDIYYKRRIQPLLKLIAPTKEEIDILSELYFDIPEFSKEFILDQLNTEQIKPLPPLVEKWSLSGYWG